MDVKWTSEQKKVIDLRDRDILVSAAAGSGKTAVLVERIVNRICVDNPPPALILLPKRICSATYPANLSILALLSELSVKAALPSVFASAKQSSMPSSSHTGSAIYGDAPITATYLPLLFATAHVSTGKSVD